MKSKIFLPLLMISGVLLFNGCAKDGAVGPQGPQGPQGNANVLAATYEVDTWTADNTNLLWYASFNVPEITTDANNGGAILVYFSIDAGSVWNAMPFTALSSPNNYQMTYSTQSGSIEVDWTYGGSSLGQNPNTFYNATSLFKVVVIPQAMKKVNVDVTSYMKVKAAYGLKD